MHRNALLLEFRVPGIYVGNVEMDKAANRAIIFMFGQKKSQPVPRDLHEDWEMLFEAVLPIDLKAEAVNVESLALRVASDSQSGHNPLPSFSTAHFCPQNPANSCGEQGYKTPLLPSKVIFVFYHRGLRDQQPRQFGRTPKEFAASNISEFTHRERMRVTDFRSATKISNRTRLIGW
jgi:hypothetical protein